MKEFIKGLRMYGKDFFKIGKGFLPHREIPELVEFYYLWKKTPGAASNRPRGKKRPNVIRRVKTSGKNSSGKGHRNEDDPDDLSSCSEEPDDSNDNGEKDDLSPYYCRHCYTTSSRDWHHAGKEKLLACLDCRIYFKKYGELPCLEPSNLDEEEEETTSEEEEIIEDIKPPTDKKIDINAIEQDSSAEDTVAVVTDSFDDNVPPPPPVNGGTVAGNEPVEIKGELPKSSIGLLSPVPTMGTQLTPHQAQPPNLHPGMHHPLAAQVPGSSVLPPANLLPGPPPAHSNNEVQVLSKPQAQPPPHVPQQQQQQQQQMHQQHQQQHQQQQPPTPQPPPPREDSPPPKPDGSECHRSQSAIFTRQWNRGEGNSCSRTDLYFKPVPDSKLDRKRQERLRKAANEREDAMKVRRAEEQEQADRAARQQLNNHFDQIARHTPHPTPPSLGLAPGLGSPFPQHLSEIERYERERQMTAAALSAAAGGSPRPPYPNPPGTPGPPGSAAAAAAAQVAAAGAMQAAFGRHGLPGMEAANQRGLEELVRANMVRESMSASMSAERQYAERMSALATDPLVRLQLAGVNPEIPGSGLHPAQAAYASLMAGNPMAGGPRPPVPPGFDPRFRSPADLMALRPPPGFSPRPSFPPADLYQRQIMMEREHAIRAASAHQHASLMAQQEEFLRLEQEARARNPQVSRP